MFGTGLGVKLKRAAAALSGGEGASPTEAGRHPDPALFEIRTGPDFPALALTAPTRFERLFYGHTGLPVFKWRHYLPIYDAVLAPFVGRPVTLVEIGLAGGGSLQLWRAFLGPQCRIIGVDIEPGALSLAGPGVEIMIGDQGDPAFLQQLVDRAGPIDIVIDDGSHRVKDQILTLETLFPKLKPGGVFLCEDLHTSYWDVYEGGLGRPGTFIEHLKAMLDRMHARYNGLSLAPDDIVRTVGSMQLADSIAVLHKAEPTETYIVGTGR